MITFKYCLQKKETFSFFFKSVCVCMFVCMYEHVWMHVESRSVFFRVLSILVLERESHWTWSSIGLTGHQVPKILLSRNYSHGQHLSFLHGCEVLGMFNKHFTKSPLSPASEVWYICLCSLNTTYLSSSQRHIE